MSKQKENKPPLNSKQLRFIEEYLIDFNGKQAAIRAGYAPASAEVQASRLLSKDKVSSQIKVKQDLMNKKFEITREDLIKDLIYIKDKQKDAFPPSAINAIKEIGKFLGLYEPDKVEHSGILPIQINLIKPEDETDKGKED